ncbi:hypothetical protein ES708_34943 [subsurface metagenome]
MKCPLRFKELIEVDDAERWRGADCIKEECAWWEETQDVCSVKNMGRMLGYMSLDLTQILDKLPPAEE